MYRVLTSLWSKPSTSTSRCSSNKTRLASMNSSDSSFDEDTWVFVGDTVTKIATPVLSYDNDNYNSMMSTSWIETPPLVSSGQTSSTNRSSSPTTHHFNPIENLLIEHASMSVYEQIASRTRTRRHRKPNSNQKLDEQSPEIREGVQEDDEHVDIDDEDDEDDRSSVVSHYPSQHPNLLSVHCRNSNGSLNHSTNSSICALESSTSSLVAHQRHLQRIHQRRRRSTKTPSKLILSNAVDETKLSGNKLVERQRLNFARTPKLVLHQPFRGNH